MTLQTYQSSNKKIKLITGKELKAMIDEQNAKIDDLIEMMGMVVSEMSPKQKSTPEITGDLKVTVPLQPMVSVAPTVSKGLPPPSLWRAKVDELLGAQFDLQIEETTGGNYIMKVYLPQGMDRRVGDSRGSGRDCSTGVVRRASDLADVERWCKLIRDNIRKKYPEFQKGIT